MLVIRLEFTKCFFLIANREDPDQTASKQQSDLGLFCLSRFFWQTATVRNFTTFTACSFHSILLILALSGIGHMK